MQFELSQIIMLKFCKAVGPSKGRNFRSKTTKMGLSKTAKHFRIFLMTLGFSLGV